MPKTSLTACATPTTSADSYANCNPTPSKSPEKALAALYKAGRIELINEKNFGKQFYTLIGLDLYDEVAGLSWEDTEFLKGESLVF